MQLQILHTTLYRYDHPASMIVQALRLWPTSSAGQTVESWRVDIDGKMLKPTCSDGFGNLTASHTIDRMVDEVKISVSGRVKTVDLHGHYDGGAEWLPPVFYLQETELTRADDQIAAFASTAAGAGTDLERMHRLSAAVRDRVDYLPDETHAGTAASEAFAVGAGVCQDHAHILISAARHLGFPARYVSGYLCPIGDVAAASHAWAEMFVHDLGWVGFDASNRQCPDDHYVRVACGRDYRDAAPVRGVRRGGIAETLQVVVDVSPAQVIERQKQIQS